MYRLTLKASVEVDPQPVIYSIPLTNSLPNPLTALLLVLGPDRELEALPGLLLVRQRKEYLQPYCLILLSPPLRKGSRERLSFPYELQIPDF